MWAGRLQARDKSECTQPPLCAGVEALATLLAQVKKGCVLYLQNAAQLSSCPVCPTLSFVPLSIRLYEPAFPMHMQAASYGMRRSVHLRSYIF
jgi:hypothetical protein